MSKDQLHTNNINRREFVSHTGKLMGLGMLGFSPSATQFVNRMQEFSKISIRNVDSNFEREALFPYRFKGSFVTELWQIAARLESESGIGRIGLGTQSVLWSDSKVFAEHSEAGGNALMYASN